MDPCEDLGDGGKEPDDTRDGGGRASDSESDASAGEGLFTESRSPPASGSWGAGSSGSSGPKSSSSPALQSSSLPDRAFKQL